LASEALRGKLHLLFTSTPRKEVSA
jgi:hypothetical protein